MSSVTMNSVIVEIEVIDMPTTTIAIKDLAPMTEKRDAINPQELYKQGMKNIREKIRQLPEGQDKVVMSQIWEFAKKGFAPSPKEYPALAAYGFIVEETIDNQSVWKPYSPYLKSFARIGIEPSFRTGYSLHSTEKFRAELQARMQTMKHEEFLIENI